MWASKEHIDRLYAPEEILHDYIRIVFGCVPNNTNQLMCRTMHVRHDCILADVLLQSLLHTFDVSRHHDLVIATSCRNKMWTMQSKVHEENIDDHFDYSICAARNHYHTSKQRNASQHFTSKVSLLMIPVTYVLHGLGHKREELRTRSCSDNSVMPVWHYTVTDLVQGGLWQIYVIRSLILSMCHKGVFGYTKKTFLWQRGLCENMLMLILSKFQNICKGSGLQQRTRALHHLLSLLAVKFTTARTAHCRFQKQRRHQLSYPNYHEILLSLCLRDWHWCSHGTLPTSKTSLAMTR